ncbi:MAG: hypothetical protein M0P12_13780 [Paludibacteraceae bacterium]|nr:hypothetical protein [Paludibacteraceae bacterium]
MKRNTDPLNQKEYLKEIKSFDFNMKAFANRYDESLAIIQDLIVYYSLNKFGSNQWISG